MVAFGNSLIHGHHPVVALFVQSRCRLIEHNDVGLCSSSRAKALKCRALCGEVASHLNTKTRCFSSEAWPSPDRCSGRRRIADQINEVDHDNRERHCEGQAIRPADNSSAVEQDRADPELLRGAAVGGSSDPDIILVAAPAAKQSHVADGSEAE